MAGKEPRVAGIIPSLDGKGERLKAVLNAQSRPPDEIQVVTGVRPNGRARNLGVASADGDILFFIDDDARPGSARLVENVIKPLLVDETIGVSGPARVLPADASWFQRRVAAEIPRTANTVPKQLLETNPPLNGFGHSSITTTCCAVRRSVFEQVGGFCEELTSGVDTEFFFRVHRLGHRFVMVPDVFVEHPAPASLSALWRKYYWYGKGYGQETQRHPERRLGPGLPTRPHRVAFLLAATLWAVPNVFILYSLGYPHIRLGFRPLKAFSTYAVARGYAKAWQNSSG